MDTLGLIVVAGIVLYFAVTSASAAGSSGSSAGSTYTPAASGGILTPAQIAGYASTAGFGGSDLVTAVSIALAESGGNPNAWGDAGIGAGSFGLWQISSYWHPEFGPDFTKLYDPQTNASAAHSVYLAAGSNFSPWTTYSHGTYASYIPQVEANL